MFNICKHKWEVLQDITTESQSEQHTRVTGRILTPENIKIAEKLLARKQITILSCTECGKIERYVEKFNMITLDENCGLSWELVALLEVAAEEAGYSSPESFIIDAAVKEAGKVLVKSDKHKGKNNYVDEEDFPQEEQLDLFGGESND